MLYQFSGVNTITFYAVDVFKISGASWDANTLAIGMGILRLIFTIVGSIAMRRCGRRPLTFVSSTYDSCEFVLDIHPNHHFLICSLTHRYWMWIFNARFWPLLAVQIVFRCYGHTTASMVPSHMHFYIHNLLHHWVSHCSVGDDR